MQMYEAEVVKLQQKLEEVANESKENTTEF